MKKIFSFALAAFVFSTLFVASLGQDVVTHQVASDFTVNSSEPGGL